MNPSPEQLKFEVYENELLNPLRGHKLTELESYVANLLLDARSDRPIENEMIRISIDLSMNRKVTDRTVKNIIRSLRKEHHFPIVSRRKQPAGYWWCSSKQEMLDYIETFKGQALDELHTLNRIVKANYPELAGQLRLDLEQ